MLWRSLGAAFPTVNVASGGRTKWNRTRTGLPKTHTLDALCVGHLDAVGQYPRAVLAVGANGRGRYRRTDPVRFGFPRKTNSRTKRVYGHATGDHVRAAVPRGKYAGAHTGRVLVRTTGRFDIRTPQGLVQGVHHRHIHTLQRGDGYAYAIRREAEH